MTAPVHMSLLLKRFKPDDLELGMTPVNVTVSKKKTEASRTLSDCLTVYRKSVR